MVIEGDMGWESCFKKQRCGIVHLWNHLVRLPEESLTKKVFNWYGVHSYPWLKDASVIFSLSDLNHIFRNNLQCKREIWSKPKLRNYIQIKGNFCTEPYITLNLKRGHWSQCAQLRSGTLPLAIEGRYKGIPREQRICVLCDLGVVEDEFHFPFHCPVYSDLRNHLFEKNPAEKF